MRNIDPIASRDGGTHPAWSTPIDETDARVEAVCRRFCQMGGLNPDETLMRVPTDGNWDSRLGVRWQTYRLAATQWLDAADSADPLRSTAAGASRAPSAIRGRS